MENVSERAMLKHLQKEQERERRRIRDRQRRQSMTVEERERHLARRRRNYQLRRQRAENARLDLQLNRGEIAMVSSNDGHQHQQHQQQQHQQQQYQQHQQQAVVVPEANNVQFSGLAINGIIDCVGLEVPLHELSKLPKQPRLRHIKQLARSLASHGSIEHDHRTGVDAVVMKANPTFACMLQKGMRLTRVKRLARSLHSSSDVADMTKE
ncbi:hypothetical protein LINPERHAP1_LOCUS3607 [Linum perenne]